MVNITWRPLADRNLGFLRKGVGMSKGGGKKESSIKLFLAAYTVGRVLPLLISGLVLVDSPSSGDVLYRFTTQNKQLYRYNNNKNKRTNDHPFGRSHPL